MQIVLTCLLYNLNLKIISIIFLYLCCFYIINILLYTNCLAISLYFYCPYNTSIFTSFCANIKALLLFKIEKVRVNTYAKIEVFSTNIYIMF